MNIYTIGFTEKTAEEFFGLLKKNKVTRLVDIRLNNRSQLAGFTKGKDLEYFCHEILNIEYKHEVLFAPTQNLLKNYKEKKVTWEEYVKVYNSMLDERKFIDIINSQYIDILDGTCFMCSEKLPEKCHRRLLVEKIQSEIDNIEIKHLY